MVNSAADGTDFDFTLQLQDLCNTYKLDMERARAIFELAIRFALSRVCQSRLSAENLLKMSMQFDSEYVLTVSLLEEWAETLPVSELTAIFQFLEFHGAVLTENVSAYKGRGLIILRLCNEVLRRLSRSKHSSFCGRILMFLSRVFPLDERSGLNLKGDINTDNITPIDVCSRDDADGQRYTLFWQLQKFLYKPSDALSALQWGSFQNCMEIVLSTLTESSKKMTPRSHDNSELPYAKFLSSREMFDLQRVDPTFRLYVLTEILFALDQILNQSATSSDSTASMATSRSGSMLAIQISSDRILVLQKYQDRVRELLVQQQDGRDLVNHLARCLASERIWRNWKVQSCPSFQKNSLTVPICEEFTAPSIEATVQKLQDSANLGSDVLSHLWTVPLSLDDVAQSMPRANTKLFTSPLAIQLDPSQGIEADYRLSRSEIFRWRHMRLMRLHAGDAVAFNAGISSRAMDEFTTKQI